MGVWTIDAILVGLALFDVYKFLTFSWLSIVEYLLRILEIFIYTVIGAQTIQFWNMYNGNNSGAVNAERRNIRRRRDLDDLLELLFIFLCCDFIVKYCFLFNFIEMKILSSRIC